MRKFITLALIMVLVFIGLGEKKASAGINLRIDKPKVRLRIAPGDSKSGQITIENTTEESLNIKCYLEDWFYTPGGDGGKDFKPPSTTALSCASWINFSPAEFLLIPYGRQVVNYRVTVPSDAKGGHYAVLFFETAIGEGQDEQGLSVLILGRLGSLFYVDAEGTVSKKAELADITVKEETKGFQVEATLKNTGNVNIVSSGSFNLIDRNGQVFARGQFNDTYSLPGDEAYLESAWKKDIAPGVYDLIITLDIEGKTIVEEQQVTLGR